MAATRLIVHRAVFSQVKKQLIEAVRHLKVGPGLDPQSKMGPVISLQQLKNRSNAVQTGLRDGGRLVVGGERLEAGELRKGFFFAPTILEHVSLSSQMVQHEIFGPVVSLEEFTSEEEAIKLANGTDFGLVAKVWTRDFARATRVARGIRAGTVWINTYMRTFAEAESGGMKTSGLGRSRGRAGLYEYTELKHILSDTNE